MKMVESKVFSLLPHPKQVEHLHVPPRSSREHNQGLHLQQQLYIEGIHSLEFRAVKPDSLTKGNTDKLSISSQSGFIFLSLKGENNRAALTL